MAGGVSARISVDGKNFQAGIKGERNFTPAAPGFADLLAQVLVLHVKISVMSGKRDEKLISFFDGFTDSPFGFQHKPFFRQ